MKKYFFVLLNTFSIVCLAQKHNSLFKGAGVFGSLTESAQYYKNLDTDKKATDTVYRYFYPQTHISKEFFNWGAGAFLELSRNEKVRWQTELEYINKGAKEMELVNAYTGQRTGNYSTNKMTYIEWNNYLKLYYPIGVAHWYLLPGIRLEYLFRKSVSVFTPFSSKFPTFWFSGNIGAGYEFPVYKNYSVFTEYHWNPDIIPHTQDNTRIRNRTLELRFGVVYRPKKKSIDDCNTPVYRGPNY